MKQSFRFLTMLLFATLFSATAFALDWVVPAPKASPMVLEDTFAIRNVGQNAFIYMGEAWGTQGIVDVTVPNGKFLLVRPQEATATVTEEDGSETSFTVIARVGVLTSSGVSLLMVTSALVTRVASLTTVVLPHVIGTSLLLATMCTPSKFLLK